MKARERERGVGGGSGQGGVARKAIPKTKVGDMVRTYKLELLIFSLSLSSFLHTLFFLSLFLSYISDGNTLSFVADDPRFAEATEQFGEGLEDLHFHISKIISFS